MVEFCTPRGAKNDTPSLQEPNTYKSPPVDGEASLPAAGAGTAAAGPGGSLAWGEDCFRLDKTPAITNGAPNSFLPKTACAGTAPEGLSVLYGFEKPSAPQRASEEVPEALLERDVIERVERRESGNQGASAYKINERHAPGSRGAESAGMVEFCTPRGAKNDTPSLQEPNTYKSPPVEGEASLPAAGAGTAATDPGGGLDWDGDCFRLGKASAIMKETQNLFLPKIGRAGITPSPKGLSSLYAFDKIPTPPLKLLFDIYNILRNQCSLKYFNGKSPPNRKYLEENFQIPMKELLYEYGTLGLFQRTGL
jgi:hypothetical protein